MIPKPPKRKPYTKPTAPVRLKGKAMEQLRRDCFERDGYRCQHDIHVDNQGPFPWMVLARYQKCFNPVIWERGYSNSGHMAHIRAHSIGGGDTLDNVVTKCADCHLRREHTMAEGK